MPAGQLVHAIVPGVALYLPGAQAVHEHEPSAPVQPATLQPLLHADWPSKHVVLPAAHDRHVVAPASEYFPAPHAAHVVAPATHGPHAVPLAENLPASHGTHTAAHAELPAPHVLVPAGQAAQELAEYLSEYVPTAQAVHAVAPAPDHVPGGHVFQQVVYPFGTSMYEPATQFPHAPRRFGVGQPQEPAQPQQAQHAPSSAHLSHRVLLYAEQ